MVARSVLPKLWLSINCSDVVVRLVPVRVEFSGRRVNNSYFGIYRDPGTKGRSTLYAPVVGRSRAHGQLDPEGIFKGCSPTLEGARGSMGVGTEREKQNKVARWLD